jgi:hypothetical protein
LRTVRLGKYLSASDASVALMLFSTCAPVTLSIVVGISTGIVVGRPAVTVTRSSSAAATVAGGSAARALAAAAASAQRAQARLRAPRAGSRGDMASSRTDASAGALRR